MNHAGSIHRIMHVMMVALVWHTTHAQRTEISIHLDKDCSLKERIASNSPVRACRAYTTTHTVKRCRKTFRSFGILFMMARDRVCDQIFTTAHYVVGYGRGPSHHEIKTLKTFRRLGFFAVMIEGIYRKYTIFAARSERLDPL